MASTDQNVYVISLDAIDLNLLPSLYTTRDDRIAPLWTRINLDRSYNEYYQFEIKSKDSEESVQDDSPKCEFENILCDICNIGVPKLFLSKHQKSSRHLTNLKIANAAILRIKKYINNTNNQNCCTSCDDIDPAAYFCAVCVTVMDSKEKTTHEKSLTHKNSVILEKIFSDFLLLYNCQDEINDGMPKNETMYTNENDLDTSISDGAIKFVKEMNTSNKVKPTIKKQIDASDKPTIKKQIDASDKSIEMKNNNVPTKAGITCGNAKNNSINDYLSLLNKSVDGSMVFELQNDSNHNIMKIITIDGSVVKIKEENFHGFNRLGKHCIQCYPCGEVFKEKLIENHKMSEKHIKYMITPLEDKDCARPIGDFLSHCLICNTITEFSDLHPLHDIDHKVKLKEALLNETKADSDNLAEHSLRSRKESDKVTALKDAMETNEKDDTWIEVTKKMRTIDIQNTTNENEESFVIENKYFCFPCNDFISIFHRSKHNTTAKHISNSKSKYHYLMREMDNKLFCKVCDVQIKNSNGYVKKHVLKKEHVNKYNQKLSDNKIVKRTELTDLFKCELCNEFILLKNELLHISEKSHKSKWFSTEHNLEKTNSSDDDADNDLCDIPKADSDISYQMEKTKLPNLLNCKVCKVVVIYSEMQDHLFSLKHLTNYYKLLEDNHMLLKMNDCYCNVCNISIGKKSELVHAHGKNHDRMLKQYLRLPNANEVPKFSAIDTTVSVSTDKQNVSNNNVNTPPSMANTNTVPNVRESPDSESEMLALLLPTRNPKEVICKVCQVTVPFNKYNVTTHMKGMKHKLAQKKLLEEQAKIGRTD